MFEGQPVMDKAGSLFRGCDYNEEAILSLMYYYYCSNGILLARELG